MMDTGHRDVDRDVERSEALRDTLSPARLAELRAMRDADNAPRSADSIEVYCDTPWKGWKWCKRS